MKRSLIMPLVALAGAACVTTLAFGASGRFTAPRVAAADPAEERSVTFDANCTVEKTEGNYVVFSTTTENGNKVGLCGLLDADGPLSFKNYSFGEIYLYNKNNTFPASVPEFRVHEFRNISAINAEFYAEWALTIGWGEKSSRNLSNGNRIDLDSSCYPEHEPTLSSPDYTYNKTSITSIKVFYVC